MLTLHSNELKPDFIPEVQPKLFLQQHYLTLPNSALGHCSSHCDCRKTTKTQHKGNRKPREEIEFIRGNFN